MIPLFPIKYFHISLGNSIVGLELGKEMFSMGNHWQCFHHLGFQLLFLSLQNSKREENGTDYEVNIFFN